MKTEYYPEGILYEMSENAGYTENISSLYEAYRTGSIIEKKPVMCTSEHELVFSFGGVNVLMKKEECEYTPDGKQVKDIAVISRVNKPTCFVVTGIDVKSSPPKVEISRKEAQKRFFDHASKNLRAGDVVPARVTHLEPFGAFVDL